VRCCRSICCWLWAFLDAINFQAFLALGPRRTLQKGRCEPFAAGAPKLGITHANERDPKGSGRALVAFTVVLHTILCGFKLKKKRIFSFLL
jgi:hypothetical protein